MSFVRRRLARAAALAVGGAVVAVAAAGGAGAAGAARGDDQLGKIQHIVVIYEENHSFDNLYGGWEGVNGLSNADAAHTLQVGQAASRTPYTCLMQNDVNLTSPPLPADCTDSTTATTFTSHFTNNPFAIDAFLPPDAR